MVISSLVIEACLGKVDQVAEKITQIEGVELHSIEGNNLVITIEAEGTNESHDIANSFIGIEEVINVNLIYVNFEDDASIKKASQRQQALGKNWNN